MKEARDGQRTRDAYRDEHRLRGVVRRDGAGLVELAQTAAEG